MKQTLRTSRLRKIWIVAAAAIATISISSCGMMMHYMKNGFVSAPPASEFGLGPRTSAGGSFTAVVQTEKPLKVGPLQSVRLQLIDRNGLPVSNATIAINGGMPQHGHGLPTKPRVTGTEANGIYVVEGVRFNMGGWWELKFAVAPSGAAAADSVTFNIRL